jgi:hypothetical protein
MTSPTSRIFRQQFRRELISARFMMEFAKSAPEALKRVGSVESAGLILILSDVPIQFFDFGKGSAMGIVLLIMVSVVITIFFTRIRKSLA